MTTVTLSLSGLSCAGCAARAQRALSATPGVTSAQVNLATLDAQITIDTPDRLAGVQDALQAAGYPARVETAELSISGLSCAGCVGRAERAMTAVPGVIEARVNLASGIGYVTYLHGATTTQTIANAATAAGYAADPLTASQQADQDQNDTADLRRRVIWAAVLALPVIALEMGRHVIPGLGGLIDGTLGRQTSWVIQFVLTSAILAGPGRAFYAIGLRALRRGAPDMNSLVAVGTLAAYGYSLVASFAPALLPPHARAVYFEAAAVIVLLILVGRWLETRAKGRTGAAIRGLVGLQSRTARVLRDGQPTEIATQALRVGDLMLIRPGERIPTDGTVTQGDSHLDESMISGEPVPVAKSAGDLVIGGTVNGASALTVQATRVGADTVLAQIIQMVQQAQGAKLPIQSLVDRVTLWFVPAVMALAALTSLIWLATGGGVTQALVAGVSVLIIACPCAMGLATPVSIMVGTGRGAELGVLYRKGDALQALDGVGVVALDKTGTLTEGRPTLTTFELAEGQDHDRVLGLVAAVEAGSEHPIARAIEARAIGLAVPAAGTVRAMPGFGIQGRVDGHMVLIGAERLMVRKGVALGDWPARAAALAAEGQTPLFAAIDGELAALIAVSDPIKESTPVAINALHAMGLKVAMLTGDATPTAEAVASKLGIDHVAAELLPAGKLDAIEALRAEAPVAFVGDGINDAPALAAADVGIAIGTGTDVAIEAADVVLISGDLGGVVDAASLSRAVLRNIRQNLGWAFGYNILLIPVAAGLLYPLFGVLLSPVFAAAAMAASSVLVVTNALRLRRVKPWMETRA